MKLNKLALLIGSFFGLGFIVAGAKMIWLGIHPKIIIALSFGSVTTLSTPTLNWAHIAIGMLVIILGLAVWLMIALKKDRELF